MKNVLSILMVSLLITSNAFASYVAPPVPVSKGGTGSTSQSSNKAVTTDGSGHIVSSSSTTDTELGYVHGVTSAIQTQFTGKASTALDNIASTALSAHLLPGSSGAVNLGSTSKLFGNAYLTLVKDASDVKTWDPLGRTFWNSSGTSVLDYSGSSVKVPNLGLTGSTSGFLQLITAATTTNHTITLPATVCSAGQYWSDNGSGVLSCTTPASPNASVVDGGDADYTILSANNHVRSGTTLTAGRAYTLPACTAGNIGEKHSVKNVVGQTFNITLTADGSDLVDGSATFSLLPGDSVDVICAFFDTAGAWDIQ